MVMESFQKTNGVNGVRWRIFVFCLLSFPQNKRKIYKLRQLSLSQFLYFLRDLCLHIFQVLNDKIHNSVKRIHLALSSFKKLKSKHASLKKFTN